MLYKFKFDMSNKIVYLFCSFILIFILTYINNKYFYDHVKRTSSRQAIQLEKILVNYINTNSHLDKEILEKNILSLINNWSDYAYYNNGITVINLNNERQVIKEERKWDKSAYTYFTISINKLINKKPDAFMLISKVDKFEVFKSVFKSMTFSIIDFYEDVTKDVISDYNGQIISIGYASKPIYDNIININGIAYKDMKGAKNLIILDPLTLKKEKYIYQILMN